MGNFVNVNELIEILKTYDGELIPVILRDGNGHYAPIEKGNIIAEDSVYFPDFSIKFPKKRKFLRIGII